MTNTTPHSTDAFGFATITAAMKNLLQEAFARYEVGEQINSDVAVFALPPDKLEAAGVESAKVNLYLYQIMPNARIADLTGLGERALKALPNTEDRRQSASSPSSEPTEKSANPAPLGIDLYYMITVIGPRDTQAELMLGIIFKTFYECNKLDRKTIQHALHSLVKRSSDAETTPSPPTPAPLDHRVKSIEIVPQFLGMEEMSRIWGMFQTRYRPSLVYRVTNIQLVGPNTTV